MRVEERGKDLETSPRGEFWRLLTPGVFLSVMAVECVPALGLYITCVDQVSTPSGHTQREGAVERCRLRLRRVKLAQGLISSW